MNKKLNYPIIALILALTQFISNPEKFTDHIKFTIIFTVLILILFKEIYHEKKIEI